VVCVVPLQDAPAAHAYAYASGLLPTAPKLKGVPAGATADHEAAGSKLAGDAKQISEEGQIKLEPASKGEHIRDNPETAKLKEQLRLQAVMLQRYQQAEGCAS